MAKEIKFTLDLKVNGVSSLVTVRANAEEMAKSIEDATKKTTAFKRIMKSIGEASVPMNATIQCFQQLRSSMSELTEENGRFSAAMRAANTMAGKSAEDFTKLKDKVSELSKTVPVARDELVNGLYQVVSNGVPEDNWISFLEASARSSVGGMTDLGEAVKVTSTVIKNYGMSWDQAAAVQDKIQLTAKNGVTSFEQLAMALPRVTGNAATLGVSIDELMATFATLTGVSGNTAEVSTQLAAIFTALVKPSSEATKMAAEMGIQFDAAAIKAAGGFQAFITKLDESVKSYARSSGVLEQEVYGKLFGSAESLRAMGPLTGQLAETFGRNVETMKGSAGTMDEAFNTMSQGVGSSFQMMKNKFGDLTDSFAGAINYAMPFLNLISTVGIFSMSVTSVGTALKAAGVAMAGYIQKTALATAVQKAWNVAAGLGRSFAVILTRSITSLASAMGIASVSVRTFTWVVRGLEIATGVGAILAAVSIATDVFGNSAEKAADKVEQLSEAEQIAKQQEQQIQQTRQEAAAAMQVEIAKLKELIDSHADATKEVRASTISMAKYSALTKRRPTGMTR